MIAYASNNRHVKKASSALPEAARFYDGANYVVADSVGRLLHQVMFAMRRNIEQRMTAHDLTAAQWYPLWKLKFAAGSTAQELARDMDVDAGSMTRLLDRLEAKSLIERVRSATDRRVVDLALTAAGEAVVEHVPHVLAEVNNQYLRGFSHAQWTQLRRLLQRMLANAPQSMSEAVADSTRARR